MLRVFENKVLRKIFRSKGDEVTEEWRRVHNKEPYDLYCALITIWVIKPRRMTWAGHVTRMGDRRGAYTVLVGRSEGNNTWKT